MFLIKRIEQLHQELNHYYSQVTAFQDKDSQYYKDIVAKFSKNLIELESLIEDMRNYNKKRNPLININNEI